MGIAVIVLSSLSAKINFFITGNRIKSPNENIPVNLHSCSTYLSPVCYLDLIAQFKCSKIEQFGIDFVKQKHRILL